MTVVTNINRSTVTKVTNLISKVEGEERAPTLVRWIRTSLNSTNTLTEEERFEAEKALLRAKKEYGRAFQELARC